MSTSNAWAGATRRVGLPATLVLTGLLAVLPFPHASAQTFGGAGGTGSNGPGGAGGGLDMPGGNAPAGSNGGGGGGGSGLANAASAPINMTGGGEPGGAGDGTGGAGGAGGANGYDATVGAFDGTATYAGAGGVAGNGSASGTGGGGGGGAGGIGAVLQGSGTFGTTAQLSGGNGGDGGDSGMPGTAAGSGSAGNGGIGVYLSGPLTFTVNPAGAVGGGAGGYGGTQFGAGVAGKSGNGGTGIYVTGGATLINEGAIGGGEGRSENFASAVPGAGGSGGDGVYISRGTLINAVNATIGGGDGGSSVTMPGVGGAGVTGSDLTVVNAGMIAGGSGAGPAPGGVGVLGSNLTIGNTGGTISGGMSGDLTTQTYAIQLTGGTNYIGTGGQIFGGIDVAGGSFQPALNGSAVGTPLNINSGPITFAPGSFYNVRITSTASDMVNAVTGGATLAGATVDVLAVQGPYSVGQQYTILSAAGGLGGTVFAGATSNLAFLRPTLSYDADDVFLTLTQGSFTSGAVTRDQFAVATGLNNAVRVGGTSQPLIVALDQLIVGQAPAVLDSLSGEGIAAAQNTAFGSTSLFLSSIFDQTTFYGGDAGSSPNQITLTAPVPGFTAYAPSDGSFARTPIHELADLPSAVAPIPAPVFVPQRTWRAWATGFGGVEDFSGNGAVGSAGQSDSIYGGTLGIDYQLMPNYLAGLAIGGSNGDFSVPGRATSGSTTGGHVAFYDLATFGAFYAASTNSASFYSNQTTRTIAGFGGLAGETDRGNFRSDAYSSKVEFGRHFAAYGGLITPFASIELTELRSYGFTETPLAGPGLFALNVQGQDTASVPSLVGARFQTLLPLGNGLVFSPSLQLAWEHQFSPQRPVLAGLINLPGAVFLTNGASPARDSAAVKAGGELAITRQAALFANFDGDFSGIDRFYGGKGGFKYVW